MPTAVAEIAAVPTIELLPGMNAWQLGDVVVVDGARLPAELNAAELDALLERLGRLRASLG